MYQKMLTFEVTATSLPDFLQVSVSELLSSFLTVVTDCNTKTLKVIGLW